MPNVPRGTGSDQTEIVRDGMRQSKKITVELDRVLLIRQPLLCRRFRDLAGCNGGQRLKKIAKR